MTNYRRYTLPWDRPAEEQRRFRRLVLGVVTTVGLLTLLVSVLPVTEPDWDDEAEVPARLARLLIDRPEPPPPPPPPPVPERAPEPLPPEPVPPVERSPEPAPQRIAERPPEPAVAPVPEPVVPPPEPVVDRTREAREEAASAAMPMADALAGLRDNRALGAVTAAEARIGSVDDARRSERALLTRDTAGASGGVDTSTLSRDTGGSGLSDRETTRVASTVAGMRPDDAAAARSAGGVPARSREEIELVFDQNKGAIYALYNRALRANPSLQGKLVLLLTIEPSGEVSDAEIVSSELDDAELERRLVQRVRLFRFEARDVAPVTTTKPIDFFPV